MHRIEMINNDIALSLNETSPSIPSLKEETRRMFLFEALIQASEMIGRLKQTLPTFPHPVPCRGRVSDQDVEGTILFAEFSYPVLILLQSLLLVTVESDEEMGGGVSESKMSAL